MSPTDSISALIHGYMYDPGIIIRVHVVGKGRYYKPRLLTRVGNGSSQGEINLLCAQSTTFHCSQEMASFSGQQQKQRSSTSQLEVELHPGDEYLGSLEPQSLQVLVSSS